MNEGKKERKGNGIRQKEKDKTKAPDCFHVKKASVIIMRKSCHKFNLVQTSWKVKVKIKWGYLAPVATIYNY